MIPRDKWEWFGNAGHFICASHCRFHLCTLVGDYLVSTVGQYVPDPAVREILAESRNIVLEGRGDDREADWMKKHGYDEIGYGRTFETMVFKVTGKRCTSPDCNCALPKIIPNELDFEGYTNTGAATKGHHAMCAKWADPESAAVQEVLKDSCAADPQPTKREA